MPIAQSFEQARAQIEPLVERFDRNRDTYKRVDYKETQVRIEFIDPFFEALGWDVRNTRGYAEPYKEVVHEDALKVSGATRAPDYCFRIGGTRKFFLEAKKPSVSLQGDVGPAYQLRRYAWSAKLPLSVLTDFEEFAVYDCQQRPKPSDGPAVARVKYLTYDQYLDHLEELYGVFSREAVPLGGFDRFVESTLGKRGTGQVDTEFLKEIEGWRDLLARNLALRNRALSVHNLNFAVQHTIDRILFLRMAEDRGLEEYGRLLALTNGPHIYERLIDTLYRQADEKYNSGLFDFQADGLTPSLTIDDKILKPILKGLYYPESPYEFAVLPVEVLGQVYEQFLGKVIRLTPGHVAKVEEKPEVKKAGGVYYTPAYIVDYIVRQTVGALTEGKSPRELRGARNKPPLRVLDPACGSGSFLLGAYQFLLDHYRRWYEENDPESHARGKQPAVYQGPHGDWRLTGAEKKRILLDHIYGVDIDRQAVEVTKLSLLLKVLEGETDETLGQQLSFWQERALPDLGHNIKCGNSLIGPDYFEGQLLPDEEEMRRVNPFDWQAEFPQVFVGGEGGFDAVIGNPPYGADLSSGENAYLLTHYPLQQYQLDTYLLFVERGLDLSCENGFFGMIIPNTWLLNLHCEAIRKYLFDQTTIHSIRHFLRSVFPRVTVDTEVVIISKQIPSDSHEVSIFVVAKDGSITQHMIAQKRWKEGRGKSVNILNRPEFEALAGSLRAYPVLDELCVITQGAKPFQVGKGKPPQTRKIVTEKPFVSERRLDPTFRPLLRGSLIQRYQIKWNDDYWISFGDWLAEPRYSAGFDEPEKLVIRQTGDSLVATIDRQQFVVRDNLYTIRPRTQANDLPYVLGLLNSQLLNWYYQNAVNPEKGESLAQVKRGHLARLPIRTIDFSDPADVARHDRMVALVERMLDLHKKLAAAAIPADRTLYQRQIDATDRQIDALVYELYGLSEDEVRIVEESTQK